MLVSEAISCDESECEDGKSIQVVKGLPWKSERVSLFFSKIDEEHAIRSLNRPAGK